jgi:hypothetical protein
MLLRAARQRLWWRHMKETRPELRHWHARTAAGQARLPWPVVGLVDMLESPTHPQVPGDHQPDRAAPAGIRPADLEDE